MNSTTQPHTPTPWRRHDAEHDAIVGPDRKAIALVMGRSRSDKEDAANLDFIIRACNSHARLLAENAALVAALGKIADAGPAQKPDQDQVYWETLNAGIPEDAEGIYSAMLAYWECAEIARSALATTKEGAK